MEGKARSGTEMSFPSPGRKGTQRSATLPGVDLVRSVDLLLGPWYVQ